MVAAIIARFQFPLQVEIDQYLKREGRNSHNYLDPVLAHQFLGFYAHTSGNHYRASKLM